MLGAAETISAWPVLNERPHTLLMVALHLQGNALAAVVDRMQSRGAVSQHGGRRKRFLRKMMRLLLRPMFQLEQPLYSSPCRSVQKRKSHGSRMDIRDVARRANVSISTVSRVTNGKGTVNREMARARLAGCPRTQLSATTHRRARSSPGGATSSGLMVTEITNPFFPELIQRFEQFAVESGYEVLLASTPERRCQYRHVCASDVAAQGRTALR